MWPWEHLAVGYLSYSAYAHLSGEGAPAGGPTVALAFGTQFPDLVDKPLAWGLDLLPSGHSLAHSLLFALPVVGVGLVLGRLLGRERTAAAFALGYLLHLPGDVFYPFLLGGPINYDFLLWPLVPTAPSELSLGLFEMVWALFSRYLVELFRKDVSIYLALEAGLVALTFVVWVADGSPPLDALRPERRRPDDRPVDGD